MKKKQDVIDFMKAQKASPMQKKKLDELKGGGSGKPVFIPELMGKQFLEKLKELTIQEGSNE